jgi:hypothetical protein
MAKDSEKKPGAKPSGGPKPAGAGEKKARPPKGAPAGQPAPETAAAPRSQSGKARLREHYSKNVITALKKDFNYTNPMAVR